MKWKSLFSKEEDTTKGFLVETSDKIQQGENHNDTSKNQNLYKGPILDTSPSEFEYLPLPELTGIQLGSYPAYLKSEKQNTAYGLFWTFADLENYNSALEGILFFLQNKEKTNVKYTVREDETLSFEIIHELCKVEGFFDGKVLHASTLIARKKENDPYLMKRLIYRNDGMRYCRIAIQNEDEIVNVLNLRTTAISPETLIEAFIELVYGVEDVQYLLQKEFKKDVLPFDESLRISLPEKEVETKCFYTRKWIGEITSFLDAHQQKDFKNMNTYLPGLLIRRIMYLCGPIDPLRSLLYKVDNPLYRVEIRKGYSVDELFKLSMKEMEAIKVISDEQLKASFVRVTSTFQVYKKFSYEETSEGFGYDFIVNAAKNASKRGQVDYSLYLLESAMIYLLHNFQISYFLRGICHLELMVIHADYFKELGILPDNALNENGIPQEVYVKNYFHAIHENNKDTSSELIDYTISDLNYNSVYDFCMSLCELMLPLTISLQKNK